MNCARMGDKSFICKDICLGKRERWIAKCSEEVSYMMEDIGQPSGEYVENEKLKMR
jgi:hypothetical protein